MSKFVDSAGVTKLAALANNKFATKSAATTSAAGLMSAADKTKLDGIATGANNYTYTHPSAGANTGSFGPSANASPAHGGTFSVPYVTINSDGHVTEASTKTITLPAAPASYTHPSDGANTGSFGPSADKSPDHGGTFSVPYITVNVAGHVTAASTKTITLPTYSAATTSAAGLMSAADKTKLDGINTADYLPLSGGTMTGTITFNNSGTITSNADNYAVTLCGGTNAFDGSVLYLLGQNEAGQGGFTLRAQNQNDSTSLSGTADGTLTWGGDDLIMGSSWGNIKVSNNSDGLTMYGHPAVYGTEGAFLALFKYQNSFNGHFNLGAANNKILSGNPDGTLTWNGSFTLTGSANIPLILNTTGTNYRDIQTYSTDGLHRIGVIRMQKDSNDNCVVTIGASNTSSAAPSGITITRGTSGNSSVTTLTPSTSDNSTKIATTAYVKANVPKSIGSATQPVYTNSSGVITACTYQLNATVPSGAKFTDTTYSAMSATEAKTGTATTARTITAAVLKTAIEKHAASSATISQEGSITIGDFVIKWGRLTAGSSPADKTVTFDEPFSSAAYGVFFGEFNVTTNAANQHDISVSSLSKTSFKTQVRASTEATYKYWFAIGK